MRRQASTAQASSAVTEGRPWAGLTCSSGENAIGCAPRASTSSRASMKISRPPPSGVRSKCHCCLRPKPQASSRSGTERVRASIGRATPVQHGNRQGTSRYGGVLVVFGDDHPGKSSTISHQSEQALAANGVPVLYPASVQEYLDLGLHGYALSRHTGTWVGLKCVNETVETTSIVDVDPGRILCRVPPSPPGDSNDIHGRFVFDPLGDEQRHVRQRLPRVHAYVRENALDRVTHGGSVHGDAATLGVVAAGKSWLDVIEALDALGLDAVRLATLGIAVYKVALIWPLEPVALTDFARSCAELLFVEEKAAFLEPQATHHLYNLPASLRPQIVGKHDECGRPAPARRCAARSARDRARNWPAASSLGEEVILHSRSGSNASSENSTKRAHESRVRPPGRRISARGVRTIPRRACRKAASAWRGSVVIRWRSA